MQFLGVFIPLENKDVFLWDLDSDYFLHHNPVVKNYSRIRSPSQLGLHSKSCDDEELTQEIAAMELEEIERHPLFERYRSSPSIEPRNALKLMVKSESRKEAMMLKLRASRDDEQKLWLCAINEFKKSFHRKNAVCTAGMEPSFTTAFIDANAWISFDEIFSAQFNKPTDTAIASLNQEYDDDDPCLESASSIPQPEEILIANDPNEPEEPETIVCDRQTSDDVGALIGQYVRGISFRAKHLVEGFSTGKKSIIEESSPYRHLGHEITMKANSPQVSSSWGDTNSLQAFYDVDPAAANEYIRYTGDLSRFMENVDDEKTSRARSFYIRSCCGLQVDADDVVAMEHLGEQLGVYSTMKEGAYAGMSCSSSAILSTGVIALAALYLEQRITSEDICTSSLLSDGLCREIEHTDCWGLTSGQQNEVINTSLQRIYQKRVFSSFVEQDRLENPASSWASQATVSQESECISQREVQSADKYSGFFNTGMDKYIRLTNPHMIMNEPCAASFASVYKY